MSTSARLAFGSLVLAAFLVAAGGEVASAQQLQVDPNALDMSGAVSTPPKAKKAKAQQSQRGGAAQQQQGGGNRQFGELEGWSPGQTPPGKEKEAEKPSSSAGKMPIGMSPSGNMSVGMPF
ncbi:MAG: hypothetical protein FJX48_06545 [Alphaproteobacteria bacterium]|nr:hypothetical protein [Alphaproteobacteria bacterium]